eukprot:TRINITY_DN17463_c0_g1_i14.p2 TRINITY_DN17463_c0_g1~~TRINITY_DN17463_c0_g1_i14.p2  ORF type:complete len:151 (-),score=12.41 TRINITY_DN17463_c0_g1_i14:227-679(-)
MDSKWSIKILKEILVRSIQQKQPLVIAQIIEIVYKWCDHSEHDKIAANTLITLLNQFDQNCQNQLLHFWQQVLDGKIQDHSINALIKGRILSYFLVRVKNILINDEILLGLQQAIQEADLGGGLHNGNLEQGEQISIARSYIHAIQDHLH